MTGDLGGRLRAALDALPDIGPLGIAVSGGGDSTALLLAAIDRAGTTGQDIAAATVDHGLRPASAAEARQVADLCARNGCPHETLTLTDLPTGPNLQARARAARYGALTAWARRAGRACILLGHNADDVAETLIQRLRRGAGVDGLARMAGWIDGNPAWGRPFLDITRADLRAWLASRGVVPIEDPSNDDASFDRVAIRQAIAALGLDVTQLAASATALSEARDSLSRRAATLAADMVEEDRGDLLVALSALDALIAEEPEQARRILTAGLRWIGGGPHVPRRDEQMRMLRHVTLRQASTLAGCRLDFARATLRLAREAAATAPPGPTDAPWDGRWHLAGPHRSGLTVGALAGDIVQTPWRETGLPRASLLASPAIRDGDRLIAAPLAGLGRDWTAETRVPFAQALIRR